MGDHNNGEKKESGRIDPVFCDIVTYLDLLFPINGKNISQEGFNPEIASHYVTMSLFLSLVGIPLMQVILWRWDQ